MCCSWASPRFSFGPNCAALAAATVKSPLQLAWEYSLQHPGQVYFHCYPLATLVTEGKVYHFAAGLCDRARAGMACSPTWIADFVPPQARFVASASADEESFYPSTRRPFSVCHKTSC